MNSHHQTHILARLRQNLAVLLAALLIPLLLVAAIGGWLWQVGRAEAAGSLDIQIIAGYNLVVDSNVLSPSTYAPEVATVLGRVCNTGDATLNGVQVYIGDGITPASYPQRSKASIQTEHPDLYAATADGTAYYFEHIGRVTDASRFAGNLAPGQCSNQYWQFTYPRRANLAADNDNLGSVPTWGDSVKPYDDLWLDLVIWADDNAGAISASQNWRMHMRNEISADANKIQPNPNGRWFNTESDSVKVGDIITSNGILYRPGNINQGFDNDNDGLPDYNAWFQPIGDPAFDPACFRLIRTSGVLTVSRSAGLPDLYVHFDDQTLDPLFGGPMYFTNLPSNNTNVIGNIYYSFLALGGPCTTALTPYQEVASGFDNEKFNGDYGTGIPPITSEPPDVSLTKSSNPATVGPALPATLDYVIPFNNTGSTAAGLALSTSGIYAPVVISDTVPNGLTYNGDADTGNTDPASCSNCYTLRYSTDSGATWTITEPPAGTASTAPNNLIKIQWWLNEPLASGEGGTVTFSADVPATYISDGNSPLVENCADASIAAGVPFAEACDTSFVLGDNRIGDTVWLDDGGTTGTSNNGVQDGDEGGIGAVTVWLYWDSNSNGQMDAAIDSLLVTTATLAAPTNGHPVGWYTFNQLPDGDYLVQVDVADGDIPTGHRLTTVETFAITGLGTTTTSPYLEADFGFGPSLSLDKQHTGTDPLYEGDLVTYTIELTNNRPGDGGAPGLCAYTGWGTNYDPNYTEESGNKEWAPYTNGFDSVPAPGPNTTYASSEFANTNEDIGLTQFSFGPMTGSAAGVDVVMAISVVNAGDFLPNSSETLSVLLYDTTGPTLLHTETWSGDNTYGTNRNLNSLPAGAQYLEFSLPAGVAAGINLADLTGTRYVIQLIANAGGGSGSRLGHINLDAVALRVNTDLNCNNPEDVMNPVPLEDTFDATFLEFVSADPPETSVGSGIINWSNVGPISPGETRTVTVQLRVLDPGIAQTVADINCADTVGGVFAGGQATNDPAESCVTNNVSPTADIGDTIWANYNSNGTQEAGEPGLPNVTVYLCSATPCNSANPGNILQTAVTDASGNYLFTAVRDGSYTVAVDTTTLPAGSTNNYDRDGTLNSQNAVTIAAAADDLAVDFGYAIPATLYGYLWEDMDADGVWDSSEPPISGVRVYLCAGAPCSSSATFVTTDGNGYYSFTGLTAGTNYYTAVDPTTLPAGTNWVQSGDPDQPGVSCGASCDDQWTAGWTAVANQLYGSVDYGYHGDYSIGDRVWTDWNGDGVQDAPEEGMNGVTVALYDCGSGTCGDGDESLLVTTTTGGDGDYAFNNLSAGTYNAVVKNGVPSSYIQTGDPDEGLATCTTCDSQGSAAIGPSDDTVDFGYRPAGVGQIGDRVWIDTDADAVQDGSETGLGNITISLYHDLNGNDTYEAGVDALIATAVTADGSGTDPVGYYQFTGLSAPSGGENYLVIVDTTDNDIPSRGGVPYGLSTANPQVVTLTSAAPSVQTADFGFYPKGVIGDTIWRDDNGDGQQGATESGIANVNADLYLCSATDVDADGDYCDDGATYVGTATTDASGFYQFTGLEAGHYEVQVDTSTLPNGGSGWAQTGDPDAWLDAPPCGAATGGPGCNNTSTEIAIYGGQVDLSHDFGYQPAIYFGDTVWINPNGDGLQDLGEPGIPGVTVTLYSNATCTATPIATTETDENGRYGFGGYLGDTTFPADGTYCVQVDTTDPEFPANLAQNWDPDATADHQTTVVIDAAGTVTQVGNNSTCPTCQLAADFGYRYDGNNSISGTVFYDVDNNGGNYNTGPGTDTPYQGIPVILVNCGADGTCGTGDDFPVASTSTDANGLYSFTNLPNGTFRNAIDDQADDLRGLSQTKEPDVPVICGTCNNNNTVTLSGNANSTGNDYGYFGEMDCGDLPDSVPPYYATEKVDNGACHLMDPTPANRLRLGSEIDADADGQPDVQAGNYTSTAGDDNDGTDDEDGVTRGIGNWTPGTVVTVNTTVDLGASSLAYVVAWIDWDGNGQFDNPNEKVVFGTVNVSGTIDWVVTVPGNYATGDPLFVRVRVYDASNGIPTGISPTGIVEYGEVEDYLWQFTPTAVTLGTTSTTGSHSGLAAALATALIGLGLTSLYAFKRRVRPN